MNKRQALVCTIAVPVMAFVMLLPPHWVTGSVEARSGQDTDVVSLSLGKTWVLRPHGSAKSVTLDIDASAFTAVSHREYRLMVAPWVASLVAVFALFPGLLFVLRTRSPESVARVEPAPEPAGRGKPAPAARERLAPLPPGMKDPKGP